MKKVLSLALIGFLVSSQAYAAAPTKGYWESFKGYANPYNWNTRSVPNVSNKLDQINGDVMAKMMMALVAFECTKGYKSSVGQLAFAFTAFAVAHPHKLFEKIQEARAAGAFTEKGLDATISTSLTVAIIGVLAKLGLKAYKGELVQPKKA